MIHCIREFIKPPPESCRHALAACRSYSNFAFARPLHMYLLRQMACML